MDHPLSADAAQLGVDVRELERLVAIFEKTTQRPPLLSELRQLLSKLREPKQHRSSYIGFETAHLLFAMPLLMTAITTFMFGETHGAFAASGPLAATAALTLTVSRCYQLHSRLERMAPGQRFPAISQLGIFEPEKIFYQVGMCATAVLVAATVELMPHTIGRHALFGHIGDELELRESDIDGILESGRFAALGIFIQGLMTLEPPRDDSRPGIRSYLHWLGAGLFFVNGWQFCSATNKLYDDIRSPLADDSRFALAHGMKTFTFGEYSLWVFLAPIIFQIIASTSIYRTVLVSRNDTANVSIRNTMGQIQWLIIGIFLVYFASLAVDFYLAVSLYPLEVANRLNP